MGLSQTLRFILGHPMNRGRPLQTLARFAAWQIRSRLNDEVIFNWIGDAKLAVRRGMHGATGNIYCGLHEYVDMRFVLDTLEPGDLFVDIGANVGSYTVLASKTCGANTIAIEPDPISARALRRNIEINGIEEKVIVLETALGAKEGITRFTADRDTDNRVASDEDKNTVNVTLKTLDDVLGGQVPKIIKIDVEGYEKEVLMGASNTLAQPGLRAIIIETLEESESIEAIFRRYGFAWTQYDPDKKTLVEHPIAASNNRLMVRLSP